MTPKTPDMETNGSIDEILLSQSKEPDGAAEDDGITEETKLLNDLVGSLLGQPSDALPKSLSNMWALVVGIENYPQGQPIPSPDADITDDSGLNYWAAREECAVENPSGASEDAFKLYRYLVDERGVPEEHIVRLTDADATRSEILRHFERHLITNEAIQRNDPILFYYAGHGCRGPAPSGWARAIEPVETVENVPDASAALDEPNELDGPTENVGGQLEDRTFIEYIVPYDSIIFGAAGGKPGIPDRTTRALIHQLAKRRGKNITVIFDCCHSGHGIRKGIGAKRVHWQSRGLKPHQVGKLDPDTDREIWGQVEESKTMSRSSASFTESKYDDDTYVLLAACTRLQTSFGSAGFGGVFTNAWLSTLKEGHARTYAETLSSIKTKMSAFHKVFDDFYRSYPQVDPSLRLEKQQPQCEGFNRDRIVFENTSYHFQEFTVTVGDNNTECIIQGAGSGHGVKQGTMFELRRRKHDDATEVLGSVIAQDVKAQKCVAKLPEDFIFPVEDTIHAIITKLSDPVTFATRNCQNPSADAVETLSILDHRFSQDSPYYKRVPADQADLVLEVDSQHVYFIRQDIRLSGLGMNPPSLPADQIKSRFPDLMKGIAHFNYYLSFDGEDHPFATQVEIRLHELERSNVTYSVDNYSFTDSYRNMKPGDPVPWENGEALILHDDIDEQLYALILKNNAPQDLFVYVLLFDPSTYAIELFAQPLNEQDAALKRNSEAQFGRSANCEDALVFNLGDDNRRDTGYMKIILASEGNLNLNFMEQQPLLGEDSDNSLDAGERRAAGDAPQPLKGVWDVMTRKLTVLPARPEVAGSV